jgi:hypothetical protein
MGGSQFSSIPKLHTIVFIQLDHYWLLSDDSHLGLLHLEGNNLKQQESREQESKALVSPLFGTVQPKIDNLEMNGDSG